MYLNYPKRGLRWSYGWIDRGGWKPQDFSGRYFHAQADSLLFHFTDDIEMVLDYNKRELQLRMEPRFREVPEWDTQRLRYNQFVRMLMTKGGWDIEPIPKLNYIYTSPIRFARENLEKGILSTQRSVASIYEEAMADNTKSGEKQLLLDALRGADSAVQESIMAAQRVYLGLYQYIEPYIQPIITTTNDLYEEIRFDPKVAAAIQILQDLQATITNAMNSLEHFEEQDLESFIQKIYQLFPERLFSVPLPSDTLVYPDINPPSGLDSSSPLGEEMRQGIDTEMKSKMMDVDRSQKVKQYLEYFKNQGVSSNPALSDSKSSVPSSAPAAEDDDLISSIMSTGNQRVLVTSSSSLNDVEWVVEASSTESPTSACRDRLAFTESDQQATDARIKFLRKYFNFMKV
jgi:hypothetical protein